MIREMLRDYRDLLTIRASADLWFVLCVGSWVAFDAYLMVQPPA